MHYVLEEIYLKQGGGKSQGTELIERNLKKIWREGGSCKVGNEFEIKTFLLKKISFCSLVNFYRVATYFNLFLKFCRHFNYFPESEDYFGIFVKLLSRSTYLNN